MRHLIRAVLAVGFLVACGSTDGAQEVTGGTSGAVDSVVADEVFATCGAIQFADVPADVSAFPPLGDERAEIDLSPMAGEADFFDRYGWFVAERTDDQLTLFGQPSGPTDEAPKYANATFVRQGAAWSLEGWSQCDIELTAEGWGNARFVLDPSNEPDPESMSLAVIANERACASGQPPQGRHIEPVVISEDDSSVSIVMLVEPPDGDRTCPSNPSFGHRIQLDSPLDGRTVLDASTAPPRERPWPPTESSLDPGSFGAS